MTLVLTQYKHRHSSNEDNWWSNVIQSTQICSVIHPPYSALLVHFTQGMCRATAEFTQMLSESDQMAVLCILSHGELGYVYGSDGNSVALGGIVDYFSNNKCTIMAGKPKYVIIQGCRRGTRFGSIFWINLQVCQRILSFSKHQRT